MTFIPTDTYGDVDLDYNTSFDSAWFRLVDKANPDKAVGASFFNWKDATVDGKTAFISRATPKTAEVGISVLVKIIFMGGHQSNKRMYPPHLLN